MLNNTKDIQKQISEIKSEIENIKKVETEKDDSIWNVTDELEHRISAIEMQLSIIKSKLNL